MGRWPLLSYTPAWHLHGMARRYLSTNPTEGEGGRRVRWLERTSESCKGKRAVSPLQAGTQILWNGHKIRQDSWTTRVTSLLYWCSLG